MTRPVLTIPAYFSITSAVTFNFRRLRKAGQLFAVGEERIVNCGISPVDAIVPHGTDRIVRSAIFKTVYMEAQLISEAVENEDVRWCLLTCRRSPRPVPYSSDRSSRISSFNDVVWFMLSCTAF
ncbi:hypothetical protein [Rhizobium leguminosarum]